MPTTGHDDGGAERIMLPNALGDAVSDPAAKAKEAHKAEVRQARIERTAFLAILQVMAALLALRRHQAACWPRLAAVRSV